MTTDDCHGWLLRFLIDPQEKVPIDTIIITATSAGIGMRATSGPSTTIRQQERARHKGGKAGGAARLHVDDRLPDHGAAAHPAEEAGQKIGDTLPLHLAALVRWRVGQIIDDLRGHHRFQQANRRHRQRIGENDAQRFQRERHLWDAERWQRRGQLAHIAHRVDLDAGIDRDDRQDHDRDQRRRDRLGQTREQVDDRQARRDHRVGFPPDVR
jgi:hypothetical protein